MNRHITARHACNRTIVLCVCVWSGPTALLACCRVTIDLSTDQVIRWSDRLYTSLARCHFRRHCRPSCSSVRCIDDVDDLTRDPQAHHHQRRGNHSVEAIFFYSALLSFFVFFCSRFLHFQVQLRITVSFPISMSVKIHIQNCVILRSIY